jgi:hemerythrin-like metal-binding protein
MVTQLPNLAPVKIMTTQPYVEWKDSFSVGNEQIDSQHKEMFGLLNNLHELLQNGRHGKRTAEIIEEVQQYAKRHFTCEETLMAECGYPQLDEHKKAHEEFSSHINQFSKRAEESKEDVTLKLFLYLKDWWLDHITKMDKEYAPFLAKGK